VASLLALAGNSLFALADHQVCDAMRHACDKADEAISCCCGDPSESNPSQTAAAPAGGISNPNGALLGSEPAASLAQIAFIPLNAPPLKRAPDLQILFSDLRL